MLPRDYGPFAYSPIHTRAKLVWPGDARVAVWIVPNIEFFSLQQRPAGYAAGKVPDVPMWGARDYGNRVGVFRLMEVMSRLGYRGSVALNSDVCLHHPQIIAEGNALGWEWMGHNRTNTQRLNEVAPDAEAAIIRDSLATIERISGRRPTGWLGAGLQESWDTLDHLVDHGIDYVLDWCNDDQPYEMTLDDGRTILSVPYSHEINDKPAFEHMHRTAGEFRDMICNAFDVLYREGAASGRVMCIAIHPYLTGTAHRIDAFAQALDYIAGHQGVWRPTGGEIASAFRAARP
jgi:allantoinase